MKNFIIIFIFFSVYASLHSQNTFRAVIKDSTTQEILIGANALIKGTQNGSKSNSQGEIKISGIPNGEYTLVVSYIGYEQLELALSFPLSNQMNTIYLIPQTSEYDEVIIEGMRTNKSIEDIPTRVEVLTEEIDEASTMDPSKIAHLITHSTGIQVQQTSVTSNTANVRIQGLDGRYTQILKDGFPLYSSFSGSLSIMQIPPLDLRQIEYIKGSASTLYGGGAISGLINLISKEATIDETLLHLNASQAGAFDVNAFLSKKVGKIGFTLLAQRNTHSAYDADDDGFSDLPKLVKFNLNPKVFFYLSEQTKLSIGSTFTEEMRQGGDTKLMNSEFVDSTHFYKEVNNINRITTQLKFDHNFDDVYSITVKNSFNFFNRSLNIIESKQLDEFRFAGSQISSFSEFALTMKKSDQVLIMGANFYSDDFKEDSLKSPILRDESYNTFGLWGNYNLDISKSILLEAGFRGDYVIGEKFYALPRIATLFKWTEKISTRIGFGMGYRNPTIFNQEAELYAYKNILPISENKVKSEQSYGGNIDIVYKTTIGENFFLNFNQMIFYTYINDPLILVNSEKNNAYFNFINSTGHIQSIGGETFFKFGFYDFVLFVGYTYTNATNEVGGESKSLTLSPQHSLKGDLLYSIANQWRVAVDYEFKSSQKLSNGMDTESYWTFGGVAEYTYNEYTFFVNVENISDFRQTNYGSLLSAPYNTPQFTEVWAPLDGIVWNFGIKLRL